MAAGTITTGRGVTRLETRLEMMSARIDAQLATTTATNTSLLAAMEPRPAKIEATAATIGQIVTTIVDTTRVGAIPTRAENPARSLITATSTNAATTRADAVAAKTTATVEMTTIRAPAIKADKAEARAGATTTDLDGHAEVLNDWKTAKNEHIDYPIVIKNQITRLKWPHLMS